MDETEDPAWSRHRDKRCNGRLGREGGLASASVRRLGTANRAACRVNDKAVSYGCEIFTNWKNSAFDLWIISNGDWSVTTIFLPDEY
jgi:hypothetical protein